MSGARALRAAPEPAARTADAPAGRAVERAAASDLLLAAPSAQGVLQLKPKKKRKPRAHVQAADRIMSKVGVGADTTSTAGAVARTFLAKGLRSTMGQSGSLRNKLMAHAFTSGQPQQPGDKPRPSLGSLIGDHIKSSLQKRFAGSDIGKAYAMAKPAAAGAAKRRAIAAQKSAGAGLREERANRRNAPQEDDTPDLSSLFPEPVEASQDPPEPQPPPPIQEQPVELERDPPLSPVNVSLSGSMHEPVDDQKDEQKNDDKEDVSEDD